MPDVGVLQLSIQDNSSKAAGGLNALVSVLERIRDSVNFGGKLGTVAKSIERLGKVIDENISNSTISRLNELGDALSKLQGIGAVNIKIQYNNGSISSAAEAVQDTIQDMHTLSQEFGEGFSNRSVVEVNNAIGELREGIVGVRNETEQLDFSKFDPSNLPLDALGMTVENFRNGALEARNMNDVLKDTDRILMRMKPHADLQRFMENEPKGLIVYNDNIQNTWESICARIGEAKRELESYLEAEKQAGWGTGGIKHLIEGNDLLGRSLRGLNGWDQQIAAVQKVMEGTGLSFAEIARQIYVASNGYVDLNAAVYGLSTAQTDATSRTEAFKLSIQNLITKFKEWNESTKKSLQELGSLSGSLSSLSGGFKKMFPTISSFGSSLARIAKYRFIRAIIREISQGFREGLENVYNYSKAIGSSFAPSMDSAASTLLQMKNSLGASIAPLLQSLIPVLQTVVNWFITLVNYVNQFLSLLRGQATWTRAVPATAKAFDDVEKGAKKAGAAMKDLLADWDELNIIQSQTGGGGSGSGTSAMTDYLSMFEEVADFNKNIRAIVESITEKFGDISKLVSRIGIGILGWKLSKAFAGWLGTLGALVAGITTVHLMFDIITMFDETYMKTGEDGWLIANILTTLVGGVIMEKLLSKVLGGSYVEFAIPITFTVSALADIVTLIGNNDVSEITEEELKLSTLSALKTGAAAAFIGFKTGAGAVASLAGGLATALVTFGAVIGIEAIAKSEKGELTVDTVKRAAMASLAIGVGASMFAKLAGGTAALAFGVGAGAGLFTLAVIPVALGIKAYLTSQKKDITWGDYTLTESQVRDYVDDNMFEAGFSAKLEMVNPVVEASDTTKADVEAQAAGLFKTLNILKLGINKDGSLEELKKQVFGDSETGATGLLGSFREYAMSQENLVETSITLVPITDAEGTDQSGMLAAKSIEGWDILTSAMDELGKELNTHLTNSMNENLTEQMREYEKKAAVEVVETMARVSRAAASGMTSGKAEIEFSIGLSSLSRDSIGDAVALYEQYVEDAKNEYVRLTTETAASFRSQAAAFTELAEAATDPEMKKYYQDKATEYAALFEFYKDQALNGVDDAIKKDKKKGHDLFAAWIKETLQFQPEDFKRSLSAANGGAAEMVRTMMLALGTTIRENDKAYTDDTKSQLEKVFDAMLESVLSDENYATISAAISAGLIEYTDIFTADTLQQIIDYIGKDSYYGDAIRTAWNKMLEESLANNTETPKIENEVDVDTTAHETIEVVTESVENATGDDAGAEAVEAYKANADEIKKSAEEIKTTAGTLYLNDLKFDTSDAVTGANNAAVAIEDMAKRIIDAFESVNGLEFTFTTDNQTLKGIVRTLIPVPAAASGGLFRSGDVFTANENGTPEMIGRFGNQTAVANQGQIVTGITQGVAQANSGVESRLNTIENLLTRMLSKEFVARAVPSSTWGRANQKSADQYSSVTGG